MDDLAFAPLPDPEPERITVTLERCGPGWRAWWGTGTYTPRAFGLSAFSPKRADGMTEADDEVPWHALWRLANDARIAVEQERLDLQRIRDCQ